MIVIPRFLGSKDDYFLLKETNPPGVAIVYFQDLLADVIKWVRIGEMEGNGEESETKKIINGVQYEYKQDPDAKLFRIGFTVEEVEGIVEQLQNEIN